MSRVLIVEDEVLIGLMLEDMLAMIGHAVVGNAATLADAEALAAATPCDLAILDVNIGNQPVFGLAERLSARGVTLIFATGSSSDALPAALQRHVVLAKPFTLAAVEAALMACGI